MDAKAARHYAKSIVWNLDSRRLIECVSKGIDVDMWTVTEDGWARVTRHSAGKGSAYVQANKIKHRYPNIETDVRGTADQEWKAEVWVRVKRETLT